MKEICYTYHLEMRLKLRAIPHDLPKKIYQNPKERYFDKETQKLIAIKPAKYKNKIRDFALIYEETDEKAKLITIHPLKPYQKIERLKSGRWQKL